MKGIQYSFDSILNCDGGLSSGLEVQHQLPRAAGPTVQLLLILLPLLILPAVGKGWSRRKGGRGTCGLINLIFIERPRCARRCTDHSEDTVPAL